MLNTAWRNGNTEKFFAYCGSVNSIAGVGDVAAAFLQRRGHRVRHPLGLLGVAVVDDQYSWLGTHGCSDLSVGLTANLVSRGTR